MSKWDYKSMGFNSLEEMQDSIKRVKQARKEPLNDLQHEAINYERARGMLEENRGLDFKALEEGARLNELDRAVNQRIYQEEKQAKEQKRSEEINNLLIKAAESSTAEKRVKAEARINEDQEKAAVEIRTRRLKEQGLKSESDEEIKINKSYADLLRSLKGE